MAVLEHVFSIGPVRQAIWRFWYPYLTRRLRQEEVLCLNYAFETDPPAGLKLAAEDEPQRACLQLYHHLTCQAPIQGREILEISCGHGGGASWVMRALQPLRYTALDLNPEGISFCQHRHQHPGLSFIHGDAQSLPLASASLDVVLNVEASHCYPDFPTFVAEVTRVLRSGGHFLHADFRFQESRAEWEKALLATGLKLLQQRDISAEVLRGMEINAERSRALIRRCLPAFLHRLGDDFAGVPGSRIHEALRTGALSYQSFCLEKE